MDIGNISPKLKQMIENAKIKSSHAMAPGLVELGNVNLFDRPQLPSPDNGYGTVSTSTFDIDDGNTVLLPTIIEGIKYSPKEAFQHFKDTGEHMGIFKSRKEADSFDKKLHEDMGWVGKNNKWPDTDEDQGEE